MIFFRADGNGEIGAGHVMRCLSIALEASKCEKILFVMAGEDMVSAIPDGISTVILHTDYRDMMSELERLLELMKRYCPSVFFLDSYFVTKNYMDTLAEVCSNIGTKLVCVSGIMNFPYRCDYLLNYNIFGENWLQSYHDMYQKGGVKEPKYLLGTSYAPLRPEFQNLPGRTVREIAADILISTGGSDSEHIALQLVKEVLKRDLPYTFHFIIGAMNRDYDEIEMVAGDFDVNMSGENAEPYGRAAEHPEPQTHARIILHRDVKHMAELMQSVDVAISAAGSTLYELCATQTPTLTYILADNQIPGAEEFQRRGVLDCVGDYRKDSMLVVRLVDEVVKLAKDYDRRKVTAEKMRKVVDGNGCRRILDVVT